MSAPSCTSCSTASTLPSAAAVWRGVRPSSVAAETLAPCSASLRIARPLPPPAALRACLSRHVRGTHTGVTAMSLSPRTGTTESSARLVGAGVGGLARTDEGRSSARTSNRLHWHPHPSPAQRPRPPRHPAWPDGRSDGQDSNTRASDGVSSSQSLRASNTGGH
eukprot:2139261-Rhodomonas_salina.1